MEDSQQQVKDPDEMEDSQQQVDFPFEITNNRGPLRTDFDDMVSFKPVSYNPKLVSFISKHYCNHN